MSAIKSWDLTFARPLQAWNCGDFAASSILCHVGYVISRIAWLSTWGHAIGTGQAPKSEITCDEAAASPGEREVELCDGLSGRFRKTDGWLAWKLAKVRILTTGLMGRM